MKFTACVSSNIAVTVSIREHGMQPLQLSNRDILLLLNQNNAEKKENYDLPLVVILKIET